MTDFYYYYLIRPYKKFLKHLRSLYAPKGPQLERPKTKKIPWVDKYRGIKITKAYQKRFKRHEQNK